MADNLATAYIFSVNPDKILIDSTTRGDKYAFPKVAPSAYGRTPIFPKIDTVPLGWEGVESGSKPWLNTKEVVHTAVAVARDYVFNRGLLAYGLFIPEGDVPTADELAKAEDELTKTYIQLYRDSDSNFIRFNKDRKHISDTARKAVRYLMSKGLLQVAPDWADGVTSVSNDKECPACGEQIKIAAKKCRHCNTIISEWLERADAVKPAGLNTKKI